MGALTPADIDRYFEEPATARGVSNAPPVDDAGFVRRLHLDLLGSTPSPDELDRFLADDAPDRRERWIEGRLQDPRFAWRWARVLRQLLMGRVPRSGESMAVALDGWLEDRIGRGVGLDRVAAEILTAEGTPMDNPATAVLLQFENDRADMASHVADVFMGTQLQCARCHDHPFAPWTRRDFTGFAAFFARTHRAEVPTRAYEAIRAGKVNTLEDLTAQLPRAQRRAITGDARRAGEIRLILERLNRLREEEAHDPLAYRGAATIAEAYGKAGMGRESAMKPPEIPVLPLLVELSSGETRMTAEDGTEEGPAIEPRFPDGRGPGDPGTDRSRRLALARRLASREDPVLARAWVNRIWQRMLGRGLVEPVNNVTHPDDGAHAPLLERLAADFAAGAHDLRHLVGTIARTRTYQRAVREGAAGSFEHAVGRPLEPEQVFSSIVAATGVDEVLARKEGVDFDSLRRSFERQFIHQFGLDEATERLTFEGTLQQALFLLNSPAFNATVVRRPGGILDRLVVLTDPGARIRRLTRQVLGRDPTPAEVERLTAHLKQRTAGDARDPSARVEALGRAYEDILWAMLASTEFLTNH